MKFVRLHGKTLEGSRRSVFGDLGDGFKQRNCVYCDEEYCGLFLIYCRGSFRELENKVKINSTCQNQTHVRILFEIEPPTLYKISSISHQYLSPSICFIPHQSLN